MRLRYKIALVSVLALLCIAFAMLIVPRLIFGWHSRPEDVAQTKQVVMTTAQTLEKRLRSGFTLPADTNELALVLGGNIPRDAWGGFLSYQNFGLTNFVVSAMSPYPELLIISYDSRVTNGQLAIYPF